MNNIGMGNKTYYDAVDGLRAICFFVVFLFHYNIKGFELGWSGVIVFFVISGFLITEILINTKDKENYFRNFYIRRSLRIIPIYILVLIGSILFYCYINKSFPADFIYFLTYTQNILWIFTDSHSDAGILLAHTWTLAIEEQFYLIWPLLVYLIPNKHLPKLCVYTILFGVFFRIISVVFGNNENITSILLFSQIDTLALGALFACYKNNLFGGRFPDFIFKNSLYFGLIGIGLVVYVLSVKNEISLYESYFLFTEPKYYLHDVVTANICLFVGFFSVGLLQICIYSKPTIINNILSNKHLTHLGRISYGLYLYHWPIYKVLNGRIPNQIVFFILGLATTYLVSLLSYVIIEKRFNYLKLKFEYK